MNDEQFAELLFHGHSKKNDLSLEEILINILAKNVNLLINVTTIKQNKKLRKVNKNYQKNS